MLQIYTDVAHKCPAYRGLDEAIKAGTPSVDVPLQPREHLRVVPSSTREVTGTLAATHIAEIPFVLGNTAHLPLPNGA